MSITGYAPSRSRSTASTCTLNFNINTLNYFQSLVKILRWTMCEGANKRRYFHNRILGGENKNHHFFFEGS